MHVKPDHTLFKENFVCLLLTTEVNQAVRTVLLEKCNTNGFLSQVLIQLHTALKAVFFKIMNTFFNVHEKAISTTYPFTEIIQFVVQSIGEIFKCKEHPLVMVVKRVSARIWTTKIKKAKSKQRNSVPTPALYKHTSLSPVVICRYESLEI